MRESRQWLSNSARLWVLMMIESLGFLGVMLGYYKLLVIINGGVADVETSDSVDECGGQLVALASVWDSAGLPV